VPDSKSVAIGVAVIGLIGVIGAAIINREPANTTIPPPTTSQTAIGAGNTQIAGNNNIVNPTPSPRACRDKSHGVESYGRVFNVVKDSPWMGGGYDPGRWCNQAIAELSRENPDAAFEVVGSSEDSHTTCSPFNCPQYQYHCTVKVQADPKYKEKVSSACK
jgi:hypothetical protein